MNLSDWNIQENAQFDDPNVTCLERDGPSRWEERSGGLGIYIDQSLPCQTVITPADKKYFGLRRFSLSFAMKIDDAGHDHNILILWKDRNNFSDFHLFGQNIEYEKIVNGKPVYSVSARLTLGPGSLHTYKVEHDESTGVTRLWRDQKAIFTVIEPKDTPSLPEAWVGFRASVGEQRTSDVTFSQFIVENLGQKFTTTAHLLMQNDARWRQDEYDHASSWSPEQPTIARWGCALTSAVMVLHSYGIDHFPDGNPILPNTLNTWLLSQKDGYFGEGHLNWRALTRLALEIHAIYKTTKLEFNYVSVHNKLPWLTQTLKEGKPVILDLDGHFVVSYEAGEGENDFSIHDPLYPFTKLQSYNNDFLSARLFTPSQTDLSAITVIAPLHVGLSFLDESGTEIPSTKILLPPLEKNTHDALQLYDLPKPPRGKIQLKLNSSQPSPLFLTLFSYAVSGEVEASTLTLPSNNAEPSFVTFSWSAEKEQFTLPHGEEITQDTYSFSQSPFFAALLLQWQSQLDSLSDGENAKSWLKSIHWMIERSWKFSWLSFHEKEFLLLELERSFLKKFP